MVTAVTPAVEAARDSQLDLNPYYECVYHYAILGGCDSALISAASNVSAKAMAKAVLLRFKASVQVFIQVCTHKKRSRLMQTVHNHNQLEQ